MRHTSLVLLAAVALAMPLQQVLADAEFSQDATICVRAIDNGYFVQISVSESHQSEGRGDKGTLAAPELAVEPGRWAALSVCQTNMAETFNVKLSIMKEDIDITHGPGVFVKIKVVPSEEDGIVHADGVLSIASPGPGDLRFGHRVMPFSFDCTLGKKHVFFHKTTVRKGKKT